MYLYLSSVSVADVIEHRVAARAGGGGRDQGRDTGMGDDDGGGGSKIAAQ